jgi:hypothetical protein
MLKRVALLGMALTGALAIFQPTAALAADHDSYRHSGERGYFSRNDRDHDRWDRHRDRDRDRDYRRDRRETRWEYRRGRNYFAPNFYYQSGRSSGYYYSAPGPDCERY